MLGGPALFKPLPPESRFNGVLPVESTNELFFCATPPVNSGSRPDDVDLYVVKNFKPPGK
jgi:hypothetical protein